jgi:hypothetical protein
LGIAEATEHAMRQQLKSAEVAQRGLKEEMGRMKLLVQQTRNQCAVDVRKREKLMEGLKKQVGEGGRQRGGGKQVGVREITVVAGIGGDQNNAGAMSVGVGEEGYDLRSETNEFLTQLASGLSEENEKLTALVRSTVETLRTLSGCEATSVIQHDDGMVIPLENGYETLAAETEAVVEHVRNLLTNPSFVPLEEVEVREEEICRLREGWERMESRWREAVQMMDGWRKRMARSGQTVNLEELKMGLMLSPLKPKEDENAQMQLSMVMEEGEGDTQADIDAMDAAENAEPVELDFDEDFSDSDSSLFEEEPVDEAEEEEQADYGLSLNTESSISNGSAPPLSPLRETSGNRAANPPAKEKDGFTTIVEENTYDLLQLATSSPQKQKSTPQRATPQSQPQSRNASPGKRSIPPEDEICLLNTSNPTQAHPQAQPRSGSSSPKKPTQATPRLNAHSTPKLQAGIGSRLPRPRENVLPQQSPLTMASIAAKLAASEREADAARVRAKIKAAKMNRANTNTTASNSSRNKTETETAKLMLPPPSRKVEDEPIKAGREGGFGTGRSNMEEREEDRDRDQGVNKRKRKAATLGRTQGARASRRRSTLSPWELESLMSGGLGSVSPEK